MKTYSHCQKAGLVVRVSRQPAFSKKAEIVKAELRRLEVTKSLLPDSLTIKDEIQSDIDTLRRFLRQIQTRQDRFMSHAPRNEIQGATEPIRR